MNWWIYVVIAQLALGIGVGLYFAWHYKRKKREELIKEVKKP